MTGAILALGRSHNLLFEWTARTLRARYQQSVMGWLWAIIQPAAQAAILSVVFTYFVPVDTGDTPYLLFVFVGSATWAFLAASIGDMTTTIVDNMTLVNKVHFSREVLPMAAMLARLVDLAVALVVVWGLAAFAGLPALSPALLALPVIVGAQMLLVLGIGLAAAALNVFVRDVRSLVQLGTQLWFYASPILYPAERVPDWARPYYDLNPMAGIAEAYRAVLLRGEWLGASFASAVALALLTAIAGYALFVRLEPRFADVV